MPLVLFTTKNAKDTKGSDIFDPQTSGSSWSPLKNTLLEVFRSVQVESLACVIPAWSAEIQTDTDVSGRIQRVWMPAIHAGMTMISIFMLCGRAQAYETLRGKYCPLIHSHVSGDIPGLSRRCRGGLRGAHELASTYTLHVMTHAQTQTKIADNQRSGNSQSNNENADNTRRLPIVHGSG
jgi:hypothetical protein